MKYEVEWKYNVVKTKIRDIKTSLILDKLDIKLNPFTDRGGGLFWNKKAKMIKSLIDLDAVLTGSSALKLYELGGVSMLDRNPNDLDFILTEKNFIKFCGIWDLVNIKSTNKVVSLNVNTGKYRGTDSYGCDKGYWFGCNFDIIGDDNHINYTKNGDINIMNFADIISNKYKLMEEYLNKTYFELESKHLNDLWRISTKL